MQALIERLTSKPKGFRLNTLLNLACVLWISNTAVRMVIAKVLSFGGLQQYAEYVLTALIYIPLILYIFLSHKLIGKRFMCFLSACALFFGITYFFHPEYRHWFTRDAFGIWDTIFRPDKGAIWAFLMIEIVANEKELWKNFKVSAGITFFYNLYMWVKAKRVGYWIYVGASGLEEKRQYSLDFGYSMMFVLLVAVFCYMFERKRWQLLFTVLVFLLILDSSSRGAFAVVLVAAALVLIDSRWKMSKKVRNITVIAIAGALVLLLWKHLLQLLINIMKKFSINSRTLTMLVNGEMTDDNGRDIIHKIILKRIWQKPFTGYGAFGDRQFIGPRFNWGYSHSIVYEMWADFGVIFGTLFLGLLIFLAMRTVLTEKNRTKNAIFIIVLALGSRLAFSNTFWGDPYYWMLVALIVKWPVKSRIKFKWEI